MLPLAVVSVVLGALGQVLVKLGSSGLSFSLAWPELGQSLLSLIRNLPVLAGLLFYMVSFLLWVQVLSQLELSYAYPLVSLGYLLVVACSYFLFHEQISLERAAGILLIVFGVALVAQS